LENEVTILADLLRTIFERSERRSNAEFDQDKRSITELCDAQIATFKSGDKRKTYHQHLFLPKDYSGSPTVSLYTPWVDAEVLAHLEQGWGVGSITDLQLDYLYGPEPEVSGE